jgi:hypothetical protein
MAGVPARREGRYFNIGRGYTIYRRRGSNAVTMTQLALLLTTNGLTMMALNLVLSKHDLIENMIRRKLRDDKALKDDDIAKTADCSDRTVHRIRSNLRLFGSTKAPSNGAGRPKTITPPMLTTFQHTQSLQES